MIRLVPPALPIGFCPASEQQRANSYFDLAQAQLLVNGAVVYYNYGPTVPDPNNRLWPWIRNAGDGLDDVYVFASGFWLSVYKSAPAGPNGIRWWYEGTEASLLTLDGGENAPPGLYTGPFWEADHNYDGRAAVGAGVIPGAVPAKTLSTGEDYGAAAHMQTAQEVGPHTHPVSSQASISHDGVVDVVNSGAGTDDGLLIGGSGPLTNALTVGQNEYVSTQQAIPTLPPMRGGFWIMRSMRRFRRLGP